MKTKSKKIIALVTIPLLLITLAIKQNGLTRTERQFTRVFNELSYSLQDQFAAVLFSDEHLKIPVVFHKQQHSLSCETAALAMTLNYRGVSVTENELLAQLTFDMKGPKTKSNVWGDPEKGFVGSVDGSVFLSTGYGVYEKPIKDVAFIYRDAAVLENGSLLDVLEQVNSGNPVIVWGLLSETDPMSWKTKDGKDVAAYPGEHARIVMGWDGDISNPTSIILMDPIYGKIRMDTDKFLSGWQMLNNKAIVIF